MSKQAAGIDIPSALAFLGKNILVELVWEDEPDPFWRLGAVVGIVLPLEGVYERTYLIVKSPDEEYPLEVFLSDIRTIREIRFGEDLLQGSQSNKVEIRSHA